MNSTNTLTRRRLQKPQAVDTPSISVGVRIAPFLARIAARVYFGYVVIGNVIFIDPKEESYVSASSCPDPAPEIHPRRR